MDGAMGAEAQVAEESGKRADVALCVATCRRPRGLQALLGGIEGQVLPAPAPRLCVHVVDNDAEASARAVVEDARAWFRYPLAYRVEPRRGIPQARNATLDAALGDAEWLAFIDDDEVPDSHWLAHLLDAALRSGADVITGPVRARYQTPPPAWIEQGGFFDPPRWPSDTEVHTAYTNNTLVRADVIAHLGARFDEAMSLGEDTEFFERLRGAGSRIVWCDEAVVYDRVPAARMRARWLLARAFGNGRARTRIEQRHRPQDATRRAWGWGLRRVLGGSARALLGGPKAARVRQLQTAATGLGRIAGLFPTR